MMAALPAAGLLLGLVSLIHARTDYGPSDSAQEN
jgi:hypothetical protein